MPVQWRFAPPKLTVLAKAMLRDPWNSQSLSLHWIWSPPRGVSLAIRHEYFRKYYTPSYGSSLLTLLAWGKLDEVLRGFAQNLAKLWVLSLSIGKMTVLHRSNDCAASFCILELTVLVKTSNPMLKHRKNDRFATFGCRKTVILYPQTTVGHRFAPVQDKTMSPMLKHRRNGREPSFERC